MKKIFLLLLVCGFLMPGAVYAKACEDLATQVVSLEARVSSSNVNPALLKAWQEKLALMKAKFKNECDPKVMDEALKEYNEKRNNSGK